METVVEGLESSNGLLIAIVIIILMGIIVVCARNGLVKIHTNKLTIGPNSKENERAIIRAQSYWAHLACEAFLEKIPKDFPEYSEDRSKYVTELVYDEIMQWIMFNHIETSESYIEMKQDMIWKFVIKKTTSPQLHTSKFKKEVYNEVRKLIERLVFIRQEKEEREDKK